MFRSLRLAWQQAKERLATAGALPISAATNPEVAAFREEVFAAFPYTEPAKVWLRTAVDFEVEDLRSTRGGGFWIPDQNKVFLYTAQYEAAIHELAHAWWHSRRIGQEQHMIDTTIRLSEEMDLRYKRMASLAHDYIFGIPEQNWAGMLIDRNDWEMYAGLASGMMADLRLVPPYVRSLYDGMFLLLPADAPSPATLAPHN